MDFVPSEEPQGAATCEDIVSEFNYRSWHQYFAVVDERTFGQDTLILVHAKCQFVLSQGHLKEAYELRQRCINLLLPSGRIGS
jgi:hypothetical protein